MVDSLAQILKRQKGEFELIYASQTIIKRDNQAVLSKNIDNALVKVIMGVRRSGKSTLATLLLEGKIFAYANFDVNQLKEPCKIFPVASHKTGFVYAGFAAKP